MSDRFWIAFRQLHDRLSIARRQMFVRCSIDVGSSLDFYWMHTLFFWGGGGGGGNCVCCSIDARWISTGVRYMINSSSLDCQQLIDGGSVKIRYIFPDLSNVCCSLHNHSIFVATESSAIRFAFSLLDLKSNTFYHCAVSIFSECKFASAGTAKRNRMLNGSRHPYGIGCRLASSRNGLLSSIQLSWYAIGSPQIVHARVVLLY